MTAAPFVGWQMQDNGPRVQGALAEAVEAFCGEKVSVHGAGRTDAGVHALGQVGHVDLAKDWDADTVRDAVNAHLRPHPVAVIAAERVPDDFDARFSATKRHYLYRIVNRRADSRSSAAAPGGSPSRSTAAMHAAAQRLVGQHDFTTFRSAECQAKSPVKTLDRLDVQRAGGRHPRHRLGALVPAQPGALDGRLAGARWARASGAPTTLDARLRRATAPPAGRSRRPTGFIWCGWTMR